MDHIALALVNVAAFLEFSPEDVIDPDTAVKALEDIAGFLQEASPEEIAAIRRVCEIESERRARTPGYEGTAEFFSTFLESFGLATK